MATVAQRNQKRAPEEEIPPLESGDKLSRPEFERRYDAMPGLKKAELIEGIVHLPSPVRLRRHGRPHAHLIHWLVSYEAATPGVIVGDNTTIRLDLSNEPQPDAFVIIESNKAGQSRVSTDDYVEDAPEFVAEISSSSVSFDLNTKLEVYRRNNVREYLVWRVKDRKIDWFQRKRRKYEELPIDTSGLFRSKILPGLWLDPTALLRFDIPAVQSALQRGLASPGHGTFVAKLAAKPNP